MENRNEQYERWLVELNCECKQQTGYPWNAICHDTSLPHQAYLEGKSAKQFIKLFVKEHKPCVEWY